MQKSIPTCIFVKFLIAAFFNISVVESKEANSLLHKACFFWWLCVLCGSHVLWQEATVEASLCSRSIYSICQHGAQHELAKSQT